MAAEWSPADLLSEDRAAPSYAMLVLNRPIAREREATLSLWRRAALRVLVDGGSNRWLAFLGGCNCEPPPELITGDLDSARPEVMSHFERLGTRVVKTPDQDETDFTKSLRVVREELQAKKQKVDAVIVLVDTSGRMDHILGNINTLFKAEGILGPSVPVYQLAGDSLSWLLRPGAHRISVPEELRAFWCSLVPIGQPASVSTSGLRWNLVRTPTHFGGLVSTSNAYDGSPLVTVDTDGALLWSMGLCDDNS